MVLSHLRPLVKFRMVLESTNKMNAKRYIRSPNLKTVEQNILYNFQLPFISISLAAVRCVNDLALQMPLIALMMKNARRDIGSPNLEGVGQNILYNFQLPFISISLAVVR